MWVRSELTFQFPFLCRCSASPGLEAPSSETPTSTARRVSTSTLSGRQVSLTGVIFLYFRWTSDVLTQLKGLVRVASNTKKGLLVMVRLRELTLTQTKTNSQRTMTCQYLYITWDVFQLQRCGKRKTRRPPPLKSPCPACSKYHVTDLVTWTFTTSHFCICKVSWYHRALKK